MQPTTIYFLIFLSAICLISAQNKHGACPDIRNLSICGFSCRNDYDCQGEAKCCRTRCGAICKTPVQPRQPSALEDKPGQCPEKPTGPWVCSSRCKIDSDCAGRKKCCKNRCGAFACVKPEE